MMPGDLPKDYSVAPHTLSKTGTFTVIGPWVLTYIDPKDDPRQKPTR
jgi:hypothetical protein